MRDQDNFISGLMYAVAPRITGMGEIENGVAFLRDGEEYPCGWKTWRRECEQ